MFESAAHRADAENTVSLTASIGNVAGVQPSFNHSELPMKLPVPIQVELRGSSRITEVREELQRLAEIPVVEFGIA